MRLVKLLGVALVAVFAIGATGAAGASAHEFETSEAPALLLASADGPQLFITPAGHLVCNSLKGHGLVTAKTTKTQIATVAYTSCIVGIKGATTKPDEPILAEYEFNADGTVKILKHVTILATLTGVKCTILVLPSGALSSVKYDNINSNTEILLLSHVREILTDAVGAGCGSQYTNDRTGLYIGNAFVKIEAPGTIKWI
jgi:hypothetical protein